MKKTTTLLFAFAIIFSSFSQSIEPIDWPMTVIVDEAENPFEVAVDVENTSSSALDIRVRTEVESIVANTDYRICWGPVCFGWTTDDFESPEGIMPNLAAGEINSTFYTDYRHNGNDGMTVINYCWFDHNNPSDEACFTMNWCLNTDCSVSVDGTASFGEISPIGPNPMVGLSSFSYQFYRSFSQTQVVVHNLIGEKVKTIDLDNKVGIVILDAIDFESGVYFYSLIADGNVIGTRKLVVSK